MKTRLKRLIKKDLELSQALAELRYLRQLIYSYESRIQKLVEKNRFLEQELLKYSRFRELRQRYLYTIEQQRRRLDELERFFKEQKDRIEYFTNLAEKLESLRSGKELVYREREIVFLNPDYYAELEETAVKYEKLRTKQQFNKESIDIVLKDSDELLKKLEVEG